VGQLHEEHEKWVQNLGGKSEEKGPFGRSKHRWKDNSILN